MPDYSHLFWMKVQVIDEHDSQSIEVLETSISGRRQKNRNHRNNNDNVSLSLCGTQDSLLLLDNNNNSPNNNSRVNNNNLNKINHNNIHHRPSSQVMSRTCSAPIIRTATPTAAAATALPLVHAQSAAPTPSFHPTTTSSMRPSSTSSTTTPTTHQPKNSRPNLLHLSRKYSGAQRLSCN